LRWVKLSAWLSNPFIENGLSYGPQLSKSVIGDELGNVSRLSKPIISDELSYGLQLGKYLIRDESSYSFGLDKPGIGDDLSNGSWYEVLV